MIKLKRFDVMINVNEIRRKNLKRLIDECGIEKTELARRIKTKPQYINNLLNEEKGLSDKAVLKIAVALGVEEIEFYKGLHVEDQTELQENKKQTDIPDERSLLGIATYVIKYGTGAQYERFRSFGELIRKEIEDVKKDKSLQSMNVLVSSPMKRPDGLMIVNGGK